MALTKEKTSYNQVLIENQENSPIRDIKFICPICKTEKEFEVPVSVINNSRQLTTISIPKYLICKHHFQVFIDKNFVVRGYQKVDFEMDNNHTLNFKKKNNPKLKKKKNGLLQTQIGKKLEEIYEEFWDFIEDDNEIFKEFIKKDQRRS